MRKLGIVGVMLLGVAVGTELPTLGQDDLKGNAPAILEGGGAPAPHVPPPENGFGTYLIKNTLIYVKDPCGPTDTEPRFFLHIDPVDTADLPEQRKQYNYDNLDFSFAEHGAISDGACIAIVPLPDYGISAIRTGQYVHVDGGFNHLWEEELHPPMRERRKEQRAVDRDRAWPVAYQVGHPVTVRTHLYALEIDIVQLEPFGVRGGAIESLGDDLLVATPGGRLALIASNGTVEYLDGTVPMNRSGMESHDLYEDLRLHFRVTDILLKHHSPGRFELFVTHHYFTGECTRLRLSATTLLREEGSVPVLSSWRTVFDTESCLPPPYPSDESGGKMLTDGPDHLLTTIGDHGQKGAAQDPDSHLGKLVRIEIQTGEVEVLTLGHRNPQGLARDKDGNLWATEHGPQGGDELNLLEPGGNYGWPHVSYGVQYGGSILNNKSKVGQHDEFVPPVFAWVPSIAVSSIAVNDARWFPLWKDDLLITSVHGSANTARISHGRSIFRVRRHGKQVQYAERIKIDVPIRDITYMSDGRLALLQGDRKGRILFVRRSNEYCDEESEWQRNVYALHCESIVDDAATDMPDTGESGRTDSLDTGDPTAAKAHVDNADEY